MDGSHGCWIINQRPNKEALGVVGRNPFYAFAISKKPGNDWVISSQSTEPPDKNPVDQYALASRFLLYPLSTNIWDNGTVDRLNKDFHITSQNVTAEGKISIKYKSKDYSERAKKWVEHEGTMLMNPDLSYVVEDWTEGIAKVSRVFGRGPQGQPQLLSMKLEHPRYVRTYAYSNYDYHPFPLEPCRLSYYKLPEPPGVPLPERQTSKRGGTPPSIESTPAGVTVPKYVWFLLAAVGIASMAYLCSWLAKRYRTKASPTVSAGTE